MKHTNKLAQVLGLAALLLATSCEKEKNAMPPSAPTPPPPAKPVTGPAQPRLETIKLYLGAAELTVEIADENLERQAGMMHRTTMPKNEGMLFVFPNPHQSGFWMKNTTVPLSIAYIDRASRVIEIYDLHPGNTKPVESRSPACSTRSRSTRAGSPKTASSPARCSPPSVARWRSRFGPSDRLALTLRRF